MSTSMATTEVTRALGALAQETRLELFRLLVEQGPAGLSAGVLAERLRVPPSSLSFHLRALQHAGLITQRRASRQMIYAADFGSMNAVIEYLTENCCGAESACAPVCNPGAVLATEETPGSARRRRR